MDAKDFLDGLLDTGGAYIFFIGLCLNGNLDPCILISSAPGKYLRNTGCRFVHFTPTFVAMSFFHILASQ